MGIVFRQGQHLRGTIVLGVAEKPTGLLWEGAPDTAQLHTGEGVGRQFVVVNAPRVSRVQRPFFVGPNLKTGTYRRDLAAFHRARHC
ncbi:hypothetical protein [Polaromonas sp.]|uniref:hypothetical protein n=1 Tax=Polaromonas sp. TaxID=1869339 RepID=UPI0025DFD12A|nr:hypothetical protein [Polaromonas sp.]